MTEELIGFILPYLSLPLPLYLSLFLSLSSRSPRSQTHHILFGVLDTLSQPSVGAPAINARSRSLHLHPTRLINLSIHASTSYLFIDLNVNPMQKCVAINTISVWKRFHVTVDLAASSRHPLMAKPAC